MTCNQVHLLYDQYILYMYTVELVEVITSKSHGVQFFNISSRSIIKSQYVGFYTDMSEVE